MIDLSTPAAPVPQNPVVRNDLFHSLGDAVEDASNMFVDGVSAALDFITGESDGRADVVIPQRYESFNPPDQSEDSLLQGCGLGDFNLGDLFSTSISSSVRPASPGLQLQLGNEFDRASYTVAGATSMVVTTNDIDNEEVHERAKLMGQLTSLIADTDVDIRDAFKAIIAEDESNSLCFECGVTRVEWCCATFGIFLCIHCSASLRRLGTHICRVRSISMDSWKLAQLDPFRLGGNGRLHHFFEQNDFIGRGTDKYSSPAAVWYKEQLQSQVCGGPLPPPPPGVQTDGADWFDDLPEQMSPETKLDLITLDEDSVSALSTISTDVRDPQDCVFSLAAAKISVNTTAP